MPSSQLRARFPSFFCRASIARHHHEPEFKRLNKKTARKNLMAIVIYIAAIPVAFIS